MKFNSTLHHRHSIRLNEFDYTSSGAYFLTICTYGKICLFGDVVDCKMCLNEYGMAVRDEWLKTAILRPHIELDEFIVMPNHIHGIIFIEASNTRGTACRAPAERFGNPTAHSIPTIVRSFKSAATKNINIRRRTPGVALWQRNYFERVIRNEEELASIREYVAFNASKWFDDAENPCRIKTVTSK